MSRFVKKNKALSADLSTFKVLNFSMLDYQTFQPQCFSPEENGSQICKIFKLNVSQEFIKGTDKLLGFSRGSTVKNPPPMQETWVQSLEQEDSLEKGRATHSSILAWRIPWTEEPGGLQSKGSQRVGHD